MFLSFYNILNKCLKRHSCCNQSLCSNLNKPSYQETKIFVYYVLNQTQKRLKSTDQLKKKLQRACDVKDILGTTFIDSKSKTEIEEWGNGSEQTSLTRVLLKKIELVACRVNKLLRI